MAKLSSYILLLPLLAAAAFLLFGCMAPEQPPGPVAPPYQPPKPLAPFAPPPQTLNDTGLAAAPSVPFEISFIDVGFGDATLVRSGNFTMLFDPGPVESADKTAAFLRSRHVESIDILALSSPERKSYGAVFAILRQFPVREVWTNGVDYSDPAWQSVLKSIEFIPKRAVKYGDSYASGDLNLTVLNPQEDKLLVNPESDSIALKVSYGSFCALVFSQSQASGAAGSDPGTVAGGVDSRIVFGHVNITCPVLKVSHYGSGNAASFQLLERAKPEIGVISVGPNPPLNAYPEPALIRRLMLKNISVYITDKLGTITVSSDGTTYNTSTVKPVDEDYTRFIYAVDANRLYWGK